VSAPARLASLAVVRALEHELKFAVDDGFRLPKLDGAPLEPRTFVSTYLDTNGLRLAATGVTLRRRLENGRNLWQLKLPRGQDARLEVEESGGPAAPPERFLGALAGILRGEPLTEVARLRTNRSGFLVDGAEVVLDEVAVLDGGRVSASFRELEVELRDARSSNLARLVDALEDAGATRGDGLPKVLRALDIAGPDGPPDPDDPPREHLRAALRAQLVTILVRDAALRLGDDPEDVHQLRVATRRLRAILRAVRPLLDEAWANELRDELGWLGGALGPARDLDVLLDHLRAEAAGLEPEERRALRSLFRALEGRRASARKALRAALDSARYFELLDRLERDVGEPRLRESTASLPELAAAEFERLRKAVRRLGPEPSDEELHKVRIRGKRARYAAELAQGVVGAPAARFVKAAKKFQDLVGEHQDAVVAEAALRSLATRQRTPLGLVAVGRLIQREHGRRAEARAAFPAAWRRLKRRGDRAWR
jgi:CHAD domain-containing protein